jgi:hypothetical protein
MSELINYTGNSISSENEDFVTYVKNMILSHFPYVNDRVDLLCCNAKAPEFGIDILTSENGSSVKYMVRVPELENENISKVRVQAPDFAELNHIITFDEISKIADFILEDHTFFNNISFQTYPHSVYPYRINMVFMVEWPDIEGNKIPCGDMNIELWFRNPNMAAGFLRQIVDKYKGQAKTLILNNKVITKESDK